MELAFQQLPQGGNALYNCLVRLRRITHPGMVCFLFQGKESRSGNIGDPRFWQALLQHEFRRVKALRKSEPREQSAAGVGKSNVLGESLPDCVKHQLLFAEIGLPDQANVLIDVVAFEKKRNRRHVQCAALRIDSKLEQAEFLDQFM